MASYIARRKFLATLGGAAAWPLAARAQQPAKLPVIGFLSSSSPANRASLTSAFRQSVREGSYVEGKGRGDRISLGGRPIRSIDRSCCRSDSSAGGSDRCD